MRDRGRFICLNIGCGKGELSTLLSKRVKRVIAVDLADKMKEYARSNNVAENIPDMVYAPSSFDIIILTATARHLPYGWLLEFAKDKGEIFSLRGNKSINAVFDSSMVRSDVIKLSYI